MAVFKSSAWYEPLVKSLRRKQTFYWVSHQGSSQLNTEETMFNITLYMFAEAQKQKITGKIKFTFSGIQNIEV